jgi:hypothetical protein
MKGQGQSAESEDTGAKNGKVSPAGKPLIVPRGGGRSVWLVQAATSSRGR